MGHPQPPLLAVGAASSTSLAESPEYSKDATAYILLSQLLLEERITIYLFKSTIVEILKATSQCTSINLLLPKFLFPGNSHQRLCLLWLTSSARPPHPVFWFWFQSILPLLRLPFSSSSFRGRTNMLSPGLPFATSHSMITGRPPWDSGSLEREEIVNSTKLVHVTIRNN